MEDKLIISGIIGSRAYGTSVSSTADKDLCEVYIEPKRCIIGLDDVSYPQSFTGCVDRTRHGLKKFCRLLCGGNPNVIDLLFLPNYEYIHPLGEKLICKHELFYSKKAGIKYIGFLNSQRLRLRGEKSALVVRQELRDKHGFDTKFAYHAVRVGLMGLEYITTRQLTLPLRPADREFLIDIRVGRYTLDNVLEFIEHYERKLTEAVDACTVDSLEYKAINTLLEQLYREAWGWTTAA